MYKKIFVFVGLILGTFTNTEAATQWIKTYGGSNSEYGRSVYQTTDSGYIITGYTFSYGADNGDVYLIKTKSNGDTLWTRKFGGDSVDFGLSVAQTTDGGYIIVGYTSSFGAGNKDVYLIKTNNTGNVSWTKTFGGNRNDRGYSVKQTTDGGYIIAGITDSYGMVGNDVYLIKTNSTGDALWTKTYGGSSDDGGYSILQTADGGYIVGGYYSNTVNRNVWLIKTDSVGDSLWTRFYGGSNSDLSTSVVKTSDGGYIITGYTQSFGAGKSDFYLVKTNSSGDTMWTRAFGGIETDIGYAVSQTTDGGYIITGYTSSFGAGNNDIYLVKTNNAGNLLWTKTFGENNGDEGYSVIQAMDGGYAITGIYNSNVCLIKTDSLGDVGIEEPSISDRACLSGRQGLRNADLQIIKDKIYLNVPKSINAELKIYDLCGRMKEILYSGTLSKGDYVFTPSIKKSGVYFVRLTAGEYKETKKLILVK